MKPETSHSEEYYRRKNREAEIKGYLWLAVILFALYVYFEDPGLPARWLSR